MDQPSRTRHPDPADGTAAPDPTVRRVTVVIGLALAAAALAAVVVLGIDILLAAFAGILFAVFLRGFTDFVAAHTPLAGGWAYAAVLVLLTGLVVGSGVLLAPRVAEQAEQLSAQLPEIAGEAEAFLQERAWGEWLLERLGDGGPGQALEGALAPLLSGVLGWLTVVVVVFFVGLFAAGNPRLYQDGTVHLFPLRHRPLIREILGELSYTLRWWLIGRAIAMAMVGVTTAVVLGVLGVPFALLLGTVAGLLTFVPYLGPIVAAVPIVVFAMLEGPQTALWVFVAYTAIQQVEGNVLDPIIMHKLIYIPPVVTIVLQVLMGAVVGVMGVVMATPLAAVLVVLNRYYRRELLGDPRAMEAVEPSDGA